MPIYTKLNFFLRIGTEWDLEAIWSFIIDLIQKMQGDCPVFGVLVVGETGTGKSTLINTLLGKDVAYVGDALPSETSTVSEYRYDVEGVPVILYDTPGLGDSKGGEEDIKYLKQIKGILESGKIHLVIYCLKLSETRMRNSLICTFQEYNKIGVNWDRSLIALTFADSIPPVSKKVREKPGFDKGRFFNERVAEYHAQVTKVLEEKVGVAPEVASKVKCLPTTSDPEEELMNGKQWFVPFWLDVLDLLSPGAAVRFLEMHAKKMKDMQFNQQDETRLRDIITKIAITGASGVGIGATIGGIVGSVGGPVGACVGAAIGAGIAGTASVGCAYLKSLWS